MSRAKALHSQPPERTHLLPVSALLPYSLYPRPAGLTLNSPPSSPSNQTLSSQHDNVSMRLLHWRRRISTDQRKETNADDVFNANRMCRKPVVNDITWYQPCFVFTSKLSREMCLVFIFNWKERLVLSLTFCR